MTKRILVVDDEKDTRDVVKLILEHGGYDVTTALSGKDCLGRLKKHPVDLVILDVMMPGLDGWDVVNRIKNSKNLKDIPVIMLTVKRIEEDREAAKNYKIQDYVTKPFDGDDLLRRVKRIVPIEGR